MLSSFVFLAFGLGFSSCHGIYFKILRLRADHKRATAYEVAA